MLVNKNGSRDKNWCKLRKLNKIRNKNKLSLLLLLPICLLAKRIKNNKKQNITLHKPRTNNTMRKKRNKKKKKCWTSNTLTNKPHIFPNTVIGPAHTSLSTQKWTSHTQLHPLLAPPLPKKKYRKCSKNILLFLVFPF